MIYSINLLLCAISALLFKNIFIFVLLSLVFFLLFYYFIRKMSSLTIILYLLNVVVILVGGFVFGYYQIKKELFRQ